MGIKGEVQGEGAVARARKATGAGAWEGGRKGTGLVEWKVAEEGAGAVVGDGSDVEEFSG